jgi:hypothetical protein
MIDGLASPAMALDAEMIITLDSEFASASPRLQHPLREGDTCRDMVAEHLLNGKVLVLVKILLVGLRPLHLRLHRKARRQRQQSNKNISPHVQFSISDCKNKEILLYLQQKSQDYGRTGIEIHNSGGTNGRIG